jgi:hypothetical protein
MQADPINQRRTAFAVQRKQLVADFLKGVITEQELDEGMAGIQQERLTILQGTPAWHFWVPFSDLSVCGTSPYDGCKGCAVELGKKLHENLAHMNCKSKMTTCKRGLILPPWKIE